MIRAFREATAAIPDLFERLKRSDAFTAKGIVSQRGRAGIYVFFEGDRAVHVGRTQNLQNRLRGHISKSHYSASFAFKRARKTLGKVATYKPLGSRKALAIDAVFAPEFHRQIDSIKKMHVRFIEVTDPVSQYLLELYACLAYDLPLDEFDVH